MQRKSHFNRFSNVMVPFYLPESNKVEPREAKKEVYWVFFRMCTNIALCHYPNMSPLPEYIFKRSFCSKELVETSIFMSADSNPGTYLSKTFFVSLVFF